MSSDSDENSPASSENSDLDDKFTNASNKKRGKS